MTATASETAFAKVNLALHVRRRRDDGYHELETIFAFCADGDVLRGEISQIRPSRGGGEVGGEEKRAEARSQLSLAVSAPAPLRSATPQGVDCRTSLTIDGPFADGLSTSDNLVIRASEAMDLPARLRLTKNLPVASGIGGGSADAAAALRLLARLSGKPLPPVEVQRALGADVPACVLSETRRGEGVGECLTETTAVTGLPVLLVNPRIALSTAAVFAAWDGQDRGPLGDWHTGRNDLEAPARALVPEIGIVLDWLSRRHDVILARMSGSGATCFAIFADDAARSRAAAEAHADYPGWWTMESVLR